MSVNGILRFQGVGLSLPPPLSPHRREDREVSASRILALSPAACVCVYCVVYSYADSERSKDTVTSRCK